MFLDLICRYACTCVNILLQELVSTPRDCVCWTGNAAAHAVLHGFIAVGTAVVNAIGIAIIGIAPRGLAAARASAARKWRGAPCAAFVNSVFGFVLLSAQTTRCACPEVTYSEYSRLPGLPPSPPPPPHGLT